MPREVLDLFITPQMIDLVVRSTNLRIEETMTTLGEDTLADSTLVYTPLTSSEKVYALFGLMYFQGLLGLNMQSVDRLFFEEYGYAVFGATMSCKQFQFLPGHLSFDDPTTRRTCWKQDRFAAFHEFFESFNANGTRHLIPSYFLSLDEALSAMRNHISFTQYNPSLPAKYGLLFKSL